jgi:hypothetical protein
LLEGFSLGNTLGFKDGPSLGKVLGFTEGPLLGSKLGFSEGLSLGQEDGFLDGSPLGSKEGEEKEKVGLELFIILGTTDCEGTIDSVSVGSRDSTAVGGLLGARLGSLLNSKLGPSEGTADFMLNSSSPCKKSRIASRSFFPKGLCTLVSALTLSWMR